MKTSGQELLQREAENIPKNILPVVKQLPGNLGSSKKLETGVILTSTAKKTVTFGIVRFVDSIGF